MTGDCPWAVACEGSHLHTHNDGEEEEEEEEGEEEGGGERPELLYLGVFQAMQPFVVRFALYVLCCMN
jgi:hypothetical protein